MSDLESGELAALESVPSHIPNMVVNTVVPCV